MNKQSKKRFWLVILPITIICVVVASWLLKSTISFQWSTLNVLLGVAALVFAFSKSPQVKRIVGEDSTPDPPRFIRLTIAGFLSFPFTIYTLTYQILPSSSLTQLSILVIAPIMVTLVTAARKFVNGRQSQSELICSGKKFIVTTVLFVVFVALFFIINSSPNGIDTNTLDFSFLGLGRWFFFWLSAFSFYAGIFLFSLALIDFTWALRDSDTTPDKAN